MPWAQFTVTDINFCVNFLGGSMYNVPTVEFCLFVSQFYVSILLTMQSIKIGTKFRDRGTRQGGMVTGKWYTWFIQAALASVRNTTVREYGVHLYGYR
jgi:hypothetical protein